MCLPVNAGGMGFFDELPAAEPEPERQHHPWDPPDAADRSIRLWPDDEN
jgi:hypothetical protein